MRGTGRAAGIWRFVREDTGVWQRERLLIAVLDRKQRIRNVGEVPLTSVTATRLRKIVEGVPVAELAGLVVIHNRPSTNRRPSDSGAGITERLTRSARDVGVPILEYVIFRRGRFQLVASNADLLQPQRKVRIAVHEEDKSRRL